jgi:hypothetical protein
MPFGPVIEKRPLELGDLARFPVDEPRWGPEREVKIPREHAAPMPDTYADGTPQARQPKGGIIVASDFTPEMFPRFQPPALNGQRLIGAVLSGGPLDGQEVEVVVNAREYVAQVPVDRSTVAPFVFDASEHKRGKPNIVRADHDTATYHHTNDKTADGLRVYRYGPFVFSKVPTVSTEDEQA